MYTVISILVWLGVDVGLANKVFGPATESIIIGYSINSVDFNITLKPGKVPKIIERINLVQFTDNPSLLQLQQVAGDLA